MQEQSGDSMDPIGAAESLINLAHAIRGHCEAAQTNKALCNRMGNLVASHTAMLKRIMQFKDDLHAKDDFLGDFISNLQCVLERVQKLVKKAGSMKKVQRFLLARIVESEFLGAQRQMLECTSNLTAAMTLLSLERQESIIPGSELQLSCEILEKDLKALEQNTRDTSLRFDTSREEQEMAIDISRIVDRMFNGNMGRLEGRKQLVKHLRWLYNNDEAEEDLSGIIEYLKEDINRNIEEKDAKEEFTNQVLLEATEILTVDPPDWTLCPICCVVMSNPVTLAGSSVALTIDRKSCEEWFGRGHKTCPVTGEVLQNLRLVPNNQMKAAILNWKEENGWLDEEQGVLDIPSTSLSSSCESSLSPSGTRVAPIPGMSLLLIREAQNGNLATVQDLLTRGANIEAQDTFFGRRALMLAAENGHFDVVEELLRRGASTEPGDVLFGQTALMRASKNGHSDVVELLKEWGAKDAVRSGCCIV